MKCLRCSSAQEVPCLHRCRSIAHVRAAPALQLLESWSLDDLAKKRERDMWRARSAAVGKCGESGSTTAARSVRHRTAHEDPPWLRPRQCRLPAVVEISSYCRAW